MTLLGIIFSVHAQSSGPQDASEYKEKVIIGGQVATGDFTWMPQNFAGFYYDLDADAGTENLKTTITEGNMLQEPTGITYTTTAQKKDFKFEDWGYYNVIGFLGKKYFAGYVDDASLPAENQILFKESTDENSLAGEQLEEILVDDDTEMVVTSNTPLKLQEGYELAITSIDVDGNKVYIELTKDGSAVDSKEISPSKDGATIVDKTYYYQNPQVGDQQKLVTIAVHFKNAFRGAEEDLATVDGVWQISDAPADVKVDTEYNKMRIATVDSTNGIITMDNKDNTVTLSRNKIIDLMDDICIKTVDNAILKYYIYKEITAPGTYEVRGSVATGDYTWNAQNFPGFYYDPDVDTGTEMLTASLGACQPGSICACEFSYETYGQKAPFRFRDWGYYNVLGFLAKKYFAGYVDDASLPAENQILFKESTDDNSLADVQLEEILVDDDTEMTVTSSTPLRLQEGYELAITSIDIEGNKVSLELTKDGSVVDSKDISPSKDGATIVDETYYYKNPQVGNQQKLVTIAVHFKNAFHGAEEDLATVDGVWQISGQPVVVQEGVEFDKMTVQAVDRSSLHISLNNRDHEITLSKNKDTQLMGDLYIRTADSDYLRYYVYKMEQIERFNAPDTTGAEVGQGEVIPESVGFPETELSEGPEVSSTAAGSSTRQVGADSVLVVPQESFIQTSDWGMVPANQVIVVLKEGRGSSEAGRIAASLGGRVVGSFGYLNLYQIETAGKTEEELKSAIDQASRDPDVELAFPNQQTTDDMTIQGVQCTPLDDPVYAEKGRGKGYEMIGVQKAWDVMRASGLPISGVKVGVVDDGLFKGNDEFQGSTSIDTSDPDSELANPKDQFGSHGTRIMNILAANPNNGGMTGIASEAIKDKLTVFMVNKDAYGNNAMGDLLAISESINKGAKIISCSWGNTRAHPNTVKAYKKYFEKMARDHPDVLFVCSAGNDGEAVDGNRRTPSGLSLPNMITVGNVMNDGSRAAGQRDADGRQVSKSNMASANFEVTLAAPGEQAVKGFDNQGKLLNNNGGTSMATPQVAAAAAMIRALDPRLDAGEIKDILVQTARTSLDIDGKKVNAPPELGGRILAIDEAVLKVVNDLRAERKLGPLSMEDIIGLARVSLVARNDSASPQEWKVTAEILGVGIAGTDVVIELQGEGAVGDNKRHLSQSGSLTWDATTKGSATVVVQRLDTRGCSRVLLPAPATPAQGFYGRWQLWSILEGNRIPFCSGIKCSYELTQSGSSITLTPPEFFKSQTIVGTISGNTFTGNIRNDDPNTPPTSPFKYGQTHGSVEITFSPDGNSFRGNMMNENWGSELEFEGERIS